MDKWFSNIPKILILLFIPLSIILGFFSWKYLFSSKSFIVTEIIDGDTIKLNDGQVIRYIGVDTPEKDKCFFQEAKEINRKLVLDKKVRLETDINEMDRFGRLLAYVYLKTPPRWPLRLRSGQAGLLGGGEKGEEVFINQYLLEEGAGEFFLDTVNLRYQDLLAKAAQQSHQEKKGLWGACAPDPEIGCQVKGNLDRLDKRWYHLPHFRHYGQVVINLENGDRWFCSEEEAQAAGFKKARE